MERKPVRAAQQSLGNGVQLTAQSGGVRVLAPHVQAAVAAIQPKVAGSASANQRRPAAHVQAAVLVAQPKTSIQKAPQAASRILEPPPPVQARRPPQTPPPIPPRARVTPVLKQARSPLQAKRVAPRMPQRHGAVLQRAKISDFPEFRQWISNGWLKQSYFANIHKERGHSRYVLLEMDGGWHITFTPKDPERDPYGLTAYNAFQNEDYDGDDWRTDEKMIGGLEYDEFHVTAGQLHKGTAKHFFYRENGNFLREEGNNITDEDRRTADKFRWQIKPHAVLSAFQDLIDPSQIGWPPSDEELKRIIHGQMDLRRF